LGKVDRMSSHEFNGFLANKELLWKTRKCPSCLNPRSITQQTGRVGQTVRMKFECFRRSCRKPEPAPGNPFFGINDVGRSRQTRRKSSPLGGRQEHDDTMGPMVHGYRRWILLDNDTQKIGGLSKIDQINETFIVKRKYNRGRSVRDSWLVGGIGTTSKKVFIEITPTRDSATLYGIITKQVLPGTVIYIDSWKSYSNLKNLGFTHYTVNHNENFVAPSTGVHTQLIENTWSHLNRATIMKNGTPMGRQLLRSTVEVAALLRPKTICLGKK
uniref:DDE_Tnp_IS1595 domain-containing protein n=1 Tax=Heligmosomoides polygyrus TaxID=6339 RepID=A0A183G2Q9_HELPZ